MAFQAVPNTAEFTILGRQFDTKSIVNVIYVRNTVVPWTGTALTAMATAIGNAWRDSMCPQLSNSYLFDVVRARDAGAEFGATAEVQYNTLGSQGSQAVTGAICALAQLIGTSGSPPRRGWMFISPMSEAQLNANQLEASAQSAFDTSVEALDTAIAGVGGANAWVIVSRFANNAKRTTAVTNTIANRQVRATIGTQRDRRIIGA